MGAAQTHEPLKRLDLNFFVRAESIGNLNTFYSRLFLSYCREQENYYFANYHLVIKTIIYYCYPNI